MSLSDAMVEDLSVFEALSVYFKCYEPGVTRK